VEPLNDTRVESIRKGKIISSSKKERGFVFGEWGGPCRRMDEEDQLKLVSTPIWADFPTVQQVKGKEVMVYEEVKRKTAEDKKV